MKKVAALVLCLMLMGSLFAGCQQKPKEIPPYFPHSDSIRLDVSEQDIINMGVPIYPYDIPYWYEPESPVSIDGIDFRLIYMMNRHDEATGNYTAVSESLDVPKGYDQLKQYFTKIYGQGEEITDWPDYRIDPIGTHWDFIIDTGNSYTLQLSYYFSSSDEERENPPYKLSVIIGRSDLAPKQESNSLPATP